MNKRIFIIFSLLGLFSFMSSASASGIQTHDDTLPDTVSVCGDIFYPPYEQLNEQHKPVGFTVDLIDAVMKRLKIPYIIKLTTRKEMMNMIKQGKTNLYLGMTYSDERARYVKYGTVLDYVFKCAAFRKDYEHISRFQQLKGKRVAAETGTYAHDMLNNAGYDLVSVDNFKDAFDMVNDGRCDAVMCNKETVDYMIEERHYDKLDYYQLDILPEKFCLTGNNQYLLTKIDLTIYDLKKEGVYNSLVNKWFVKSKKEQSIRIFYVCLGIVICVCLILVIFNALLRMKVKKATKKLENESRRLSLSVHAGNLMVWGFDMRTKRFFNIYCDYFPPEGSPYDVEIKNYHPDDWQLLGDTLKRACEGIATEKPIVARMDRNHSGSWKYIEKEMIPVYDEKGIQIRVIGTHKDITSEVLKQREVDAYAKRIDYILRSSGIVLWDYDISTKTALTRISRNDKVETIEFKNILDYIDASDKDTATDILNKMHQRQLDDYHVRLKFSHTYGSNETAYLSFHCTPIRNQEGIITSYSGLCIDITNLIETQLQLQFEKEEALKADKLKSAFLANMSHEIRTPLNSIVGFSEMMPYTEDETDRAKFYEIIKSNNELLLRLINDVLDLSRIESGNMEMIDVRYNLEDMFNDIYKSFVNQMPNEHVKLICDTPHHDCFITADKGRLTQVVTNFINNAKKFTLEGHIKIGYGTTRNGIRMFVEDTGRGIPKDKQKSIFDRFEKGDPFTQGTGLGLSISKAIIRIYHGKIGVDSEQDKGSTFWVWIPMKYEVTKDEVR